MDDYRMVDAFDRIRAGMDGRPDVTRTRISTARNIDALVPARFFCWTGE